MVDPRFRPESMSEKKIGGGGDLFFVRPSIVDQTI